MTSVINTYENRNNIKYINSTLTNSIETIFDVSYTGSNTFDISQDNVDSLILQLNNLTTPVASSLVQPTGFLEWEQFFAVYNVHKVDLEVTYVNESNHPVYVGIVLTPYSLFNGTWEQIRETATNSPKEHMTLLSGKSGSKGVATFNITSTIANIVGNYKHQNSSLEYSGAFQNPPIKEVYGLLYCLNNDGGLAPLGTTVLFHLNMKLHTTLYQSKLLQ